MFRSESVNKAIQVFVVRSNRLFGLSVVQAFQYASFILPVSQWFQWSCRPPTPSSPLIVSLFLLATMYGNGVYFALDAFYSTRSTYSPPDAYGCRYMYLTRVLVGEYTVGRQGLVTPPAKKASDPTDTYDSVVDQIPNPGIFVVFYDWQCYPEYLITFQ